MKRALFISLLALICAFGASAQQARNGAQAQRKSQPTAQQQRKGQPSDAERQRWMEEMRQYKRDFLSRELSLTAEQRDRFFPLYEQMDQALMKIDGSVRELERNLRRKGNGATDAECHRCADAAFSIESQQAKVLAKYYPKFKTILSPAQLAKLRPAERKFQRELMEHWGGGNSPR
jgi:Spy/CpxP family protein refolding chaperone